MIMDGGRFEKSKYQKEKEAGGVSDECFYSLLTARVVRAELR